MEKRRKNLINNVLQVGCDALVSFLPENIFYMTGFWGESIAILKKTLETIIITSELEESRAKKESINCIVKSTKGNTIKSLLPIISNCSACIDCDIPEILKNSPLKITKSTKPFTNSRLIKDQNELNILKQASKKIDNLFEMCTNEVHIGQTEFELQSILMCKAMQQKMFDTGYKFTTNPLIIASGPNSAFPHSQITNRKFKKGDLIVVDLTLRYKGYISDATRTFGLGKISNKAKEIYDIVKISQSKGIDKVQDGIMCSSIDSVCRKYIQSCGYEKFFIHSTGHGIGIDVHESPIISTNNNEKLDSNMVITIEPGIYLPGKFGVRIEDSLIVDNPNTLLHNFTKDLLIL
ncbi:MAG: M24 family metallopeptidase [Thaumarchaeota archaeon]|nr:M24 family metallopeptidase [Nitrososphaerota archaeon]MCY3975949.1 M24 family metallopeptidase [Nitrososphaerota archaeon]